MLRVMICEDNEVHRVKLKQIVENTILREKLDLDRVLATENPQEIISYIKENRSTGIYLLDVDLKNDINGIKLGEKIRELDPLGYIIFTTTHLEMSYLAFKYKVEAMDYVIKEDDDFKERVNSCIIKAYNRYNKQEHEEEYISIDTDTRIINIRPSDILFIETTGTPHKIRIHEETRQIEMYANLRDIQKKLPLSFYRCHKSYIVNKNKIEEIDKKHNKIIMKNQEECYVSFRYMKGLIV